ncbi:hypothetical protein Dtox_0960 [Desulfofarcimen acetoxidans DSM 771]|jgi:hypothetical protein|uniref:Uncharacterized protein n=1 Tax=Desulfofarcimen acetoxidans (strain ATCC 49208 / DSM 771 / KCTC 5769 / VKM B-1644 / 5575) TaxID=485916 RepID=C8W382_DESAS|nr:YheC/YheD family protein [Desulfofarcimen acetoxidans]ACV61849.1 hypothetical protein Dtox_0960 [Desulfofarcimen acetoxidans DSM 771]
MQVLCFNTINTLYNKGVQIAELLAQEKEILEGLIADGSLSEKDKNDLSEIYMQVEEMREKRLLINNLLEIYRDIKTVDTGILYSGKKQKSVIINSLEQLKSLSREHGISIICFSIDELDLEKELVSGILVSGDFVGSYITQIPSYIYNLALHEKTSSIRGMRRLRMMEKITVINPVNRFNQSIIFDILASISDIDDLMLPYDKLSQAILLEFLQKYDLVFLVPERGLFVHKSIIIEKNIDGMHNSYSINIGEDKVFCQENYLFLNIRKLIKERKYMVLKGTRLLGRGGFPLEARVYIQKDASGNWQVTEMLVKEENLQRGGERKGIYLLHDILADIFPEQADEVEEKLYSYSINICVYLSYYMCNLGSCTLDFVIDEKGNPYLLYFGGCEQNDHLFQIKNGELWWRYLKNSMAYLVFLRNQEKQNEGVV